MNFLPKASGTRPRVACEISPGGVVAARAADAASALSAVSRAELAEGAVSPSLKPGNIVDRLAVTAALRRVLVDVGSRPNARGADVSLVIPDGAVRVLLLEFDSLPTKLSEALPLVRFRLKKLLPFDADEAMVTFQIMSHSKSVVRVLAVAIPRDVLSEYETVAREAGFEPGAVLPSTLAAAAAVDDGSEPVLLVNANDVGVTTAIVRGGVLLLHRSVDLQPQAVGTPANIPPAMFESSAVSLPLVDRTATEAEWAAQKALPEHGRNPYADRATDEAATQNEDGITGMPVAPAYRPNHVAHASVGATAGAPAHSPYASPTLTADLHAELHNAVLVAPTEPGTLTDPGALHFQLGEEPAPNGGNYSMLQGPDTTAEDIAQAVSVAAAYYEDTLATAPQRIMSAGRFGAAKLNQILTQQGVARADGIHVRELVESAALLSDAVTASVPRGWLAGVLGALRG